MTSAAMPFSRSFFARSTVKKSIRVSIPIATAALAGGSAGSMPRTADALALVVLEEVAVVARELDHQVFGAQTVSGDHFLDVCDRVPLQLVGDGREIRIVVAEELRRRHGVVDLRQATVMAERECQRKSGLRRRQVVRGQQAVRQRALAQVEHHVEPCRATGPARVDTPEAGHGVLCHERRLRILSGPRRFPSKPRVQGARVNQLLHVRDALEPLALEVIERRVPRA